MREYEGYAREGFLIATALPRALAHELAQRVESDIGAMAREIGVSTADYLEAVCRWDTPNVRVESLLADVIGYLVPVASDALGRKVRAERASIFRKSSSSALGTHGHQDAGYWVRPSSRRYDATTWLTLDDVDKASGALRVVAGSHRDAVGEAVDYLAAGFVDPAEAWEETAETLVMSAGQAVTFDPRLWHASHGSHHGTVRRALAVRWVFGDSSPPADAGNPSFDIGGQFGMYTSGQWLQRALAKLAGMPLPDGPDGVRLALERDLPSLLPDPLKGRAALVRVLIYWQANACHHATDQRGMVWDQIRDFVVAPTVGLSG